MKLSKKQIIERLCILVTEAWEHVDPEEHTSGDCFCSDDTCSHCGSHFINEGVGLEFVERVVLEAINKEKGNQFKCGRNCNCGRKEHE